MPQNFAEYNGEDENVGNLPQLRGEKTRQLAAQRAGFGNRTTYRQAKLAVEKGSAELIKAMDAGEIRPSEPEARDRLAETLFMCSWGQSAVRR